MTDSERLTAIADNMGQRIELMERVEKNLKLLMGTMSQQSFEYLIPRTETHAQEAIADECDKIKAMLLDKNRKYGNSALSPKRIFSQADPIEQINVRIDDKLSRIQSGQLDDTEDTELDLIGYLILKRVAKRINSY